ncbi:MAG: M23 family metallopeptidase [Gammaproteobacteria bacterium]
MTTRRLAVALGSLLFVVLAGGVAGGLAIGYRLAERGAAPPETSAMDTPLDLDRPGNQTLIDRIGTLSARLLRLESEALSLAKRVGLRNEVDRRLKPLAAGSEPGTGAGGDTGSGDTGSEPRGGPLLEPEDTPEVLVQPDIQADLTRLDSGMDSLDASLELVTRRTSASELADMAYPSRFPIKGARISSRFGNRRDPFTQRLARHTGIDMPAPLGTPILASAGGTVRFAGYLRAYGNAVEIEHGSGLVTRYGHASTLLVRKGQVVLPEQPIATVGSSGRSTGPHLHFEVLRNGGPVEPLRYLERP